MIPSRLLVRWAVSSVLTCSVALGSAPARAQSAEDRAAARALAAEGAKLFDAGDWAGSVDRFTRAESLVHAPPHLLYLARANVKLGKLVIAREHYMRITKEKLAPNAPNAFVEAQTAAEKEVTALEPRIGSLQVNVKGAPPGAKLEVEIDGQPLNAVLVGVHRPVDPGAHRVKARAGDLSGEASVTVAEGAQATVDVQLTPAGVAAPATEAPAAEPAAIPPPVPTRAPAPESPAGSTKPLAYGAIGLGVVGLAAGTFFLLRSSSKRSDADAICPESSCPVERRSEIDALDQDANRARTFSLIGFGVGVVGVGVGVVLLVTGSSRKDDTATLRAGGVAMRPWATWNSVGLSGSF